jgi:serine/alanine adding enzyme
MPQMRSLISTENLSRQAWQSLLKSSVYATPFQSPAYYDFFNKVSPRQSAEVFALEDEGKVAALCLATLQQENGMKGYFSRRAIIYGSPLWPIDDPGGLSRLLVELESRLNGRAIYAEIRNFQECRQFAPVYESAGWCYQPYLNVRLPLAGKSREDVLRGMRYNRRREIKLTLEQGGHCQLAQQVEEVEALYGILRDLYRQRVKLPLPEWPYFREFFRADFGRVFIVRHQGRIIGGAFCAVLEGEGIYTVYYCAQRGYSPKIFPTHLAVLGAIEYGLEHGLKYLDFMGPGYKASPTACGNTSWSLAASSSSRAAG